MNHEEVFKKIGDALESCKENNKKTKLEYKVQPCCYCGVELAPDDQFKFVDFVDGKNEHFVRCADCKESAPTLIESLERLARRKISEEEYFKMIEDFGGQEAYDAHFLKHNKRPMPDQFLPPNSHT